jgi:fluoride ion exporter CrcB/FEX
MVKFLSYSKVFSANVIISGIETVLTTFSTFFANMRWLINTEFIIMHFKSTWQALDIEIYVSATKAGVSLKPCSPNTT